MYTCPPNLVQRMTTKYLLRLKNTNQLTMWFSDFSRARGKFDYCVDRGIIEVRDLNTRELIGKIYVVIAPQTYNGFVDNEQARYWDGLRWSGHPQVITNWIRHLHEEYALGWSTLL